MNSNNHKQTFDNSSPSTSSISGISYPSIRLVLHLPSPIYNPTTADFERLSQQNAQYFFYFLEQQQNYPRSPT